MASWNPAIIITVLRVIFCDVKFEAYSLNCTMSTKLIVAE
jgi:hypothetical protein